MADITIERYLHDFPQPWELDLGQRVGAILTKQRPEVVWEIETVPGQIRIRVANMSPWSEDEEPFSREEQRAATRYCYALNTHPLSRASAKGFHQAIVRAGGLALDAFWIDTETGQRIRKKVDVPVNGD